MDHSLQIRLLVVLFVSLQIVNGFIQCSKSLCDGGNCETINCGTGQKQVKAGGFCGCCDACYDILGKFE